MTISLPVLLDLRDQFLESANRILTGKDPTERAKIYELGERFHERLSQLRET